MTANKFNLKQSFKLLRLSVGKKSLETLQMKPKTNKG